MREYDIGETVEVNSEDFLEGTRCEILEQLSPVLYKVLIADMNGSYTYELSVLELKEIQK